MTTLPPIESRDGLHQIRMQLTLPATRRVRRVRIRVRLGLAAALGLTALGCGFGGTFARSYGLSPLNLARLENDQAQLNAPLPDIVRALEQKLAETFGSPKSPHMPGAAQSANEALAQAAATYAVECLHCHGVAGGGDGSNSPYQYPLPRDFRSGVFKWVATTPGHPPSTAEMARNIEFGVPGTAMPAFKRCTSAELAGLADYVLFLSQRGQVESALVIAILAEGKVSQAALQLALQELREDWVPTEDQLPAPTASPIDAASIARGREMFHGPRALCSSCHGENGTGNGKAVWVLDAAGERLHRRLDDWGVRLEPYDLHRVGRPGAPLGHESAPRNFENGSFRGGDAPERLFQYIQHGIPGTIMPAQKGVLTDEEIWSLVHYLMHVAGLASMMADEDSNAGSQLSSAQGGPCDIFGNSIIGAAV